MKPLLFLANAFINTFGITQPTPEAAERAARFIALMMLVVIIMVIVVAVLVLRVLYH
jgi:heme/copper-type cytochrome/quinol oxidase subunit 2